MKKNSFKEWSKYTFYSLVVIFACIGFFLSVTYVAVKLRLTDDRGSVDRNDRYFNEIKDKYNQSFKIDSTDSLHINDYDVLNRIIILNRYFPKNAEYIYNAYMISKNDKETLKMIAAVEMYLKENENYAYEVTNYEKSKDRKNPTSYSGSVFEWMNISEWTDFKFAVAKDKKIIDSVGNVTGVEPRMIVAVLVGEQIRLFNSKREVFKKVIGPLKILSVETTFSLGVTGIKDFTAENIERHLKDSSSVYYLGKKYEHLLDFNTDSVTAERFDRLTSYRNHYYSYMYAALFIKQVKMQWERAGFPIDDRPEILATLFNLGYEQSKPKANPRVGGSTILIDEKPHTFGAVAYEFYYSGELFEIFPFKEKRFDWNEGS